MGMDGISIANTGAIKESTSAEYADKTEQTMASDPTNSRQVQSTSTNPKVREKEEEEESEKQQQSAQSDTFEDGLVEDSPEETDFESEIEDVENPNKEFYVKLNIKDDIIELYDSSSDRLVETIPGTELAELVKKLNMASGIFVNKKV